MEKLPVKVIKSEKRADGQYNVTAEAGGGRMHFVTPVVPENGEIDPRDFRRRVSSEVSEPCCFR
jgi:hypothetical protein